MHQTTPGLYKMCTNVEGGQSPGLGRAGQGRVVSGLGLGRPVMRSQRIGDDAPDITETKQISAHAVRCQWNDGSGNSTLGRQTLCIRVGTDGPKPPVQLASFLRTGFAYRVQLAFVFSTRIVGRGGRGVGKNIPKWFSGQSTVTLSYIPKPCVKRWWRRCSMQAPPPSRA